MEVLEVVLLFFPAPSHAALWNVWDFCNRRKYKQDESKRKKFNQKRIGDSNKEEVASKINC